MFFRDFWKGRRRSSYKKTLRGTVTHSVSDSNSQSVIRSQSHNQLMIHRDSDSIIRGDNQLVNDSRRVKVVIDSFQSVKLGHYIYIIT